MIQIAPIGVVQRVDSRQSRIALLPKYSEALHGLSPGDRLDILYWMHDLSGQQRRSLQVHPQGDESQPRRGIFALRSPMRPNPIGVSSVELLEIDGNDLLVVGLDAHEDSPVIDIKAARTDSRTNELVTMWGKVHHILISRLEDACGQQSLQQILREPMQRAGAQSADQTRPDAAAIGRTIVSIEELWNIRGTVRLESSKCFVREVSKCPWSYFTPLGCEVLAWWMEGFFRASNSKYAYSLEKSIPAGDSVCLWSIRRRCPPTQ